MKLIILPLFLLLNSPLEARYVGAKPPLELNECFPTTSILKVWELGWSRSDNRGIVTVDTADKGFAKDINNHFKKSSTNLHLWLYRDLVEYESQGFKLKTIDNHIDIDEAKELYKVGDKVDLCLKFIPIECRKIIPDSRGEIYSIKNKRTKETYYGHYGKNRCGGA